MNNTLKERLILANKSLVLAFNAAPALRVHLRCVARGEFTDPDELLQNEAIVQVDSDFRNLLSNKEQDVGQNPICDLSFADEPTTGSGMALIALSVAWETVTGCGESYDRLRDELTTITQQKLGLAGHELGAEATEAWLEALCGMRIVSEVESSL